MALLGATRLLNSIEKFCQHVYLEQQNHKFHIDGGFFNIFSIPFEICSYFEKKLLMNPCMKLNIDIHKLFVI